jgi:hypothetical protein
MNFGVTSHITTRMSVNIIAYEGRSSTLQNCELRYMVHLVQFGNKQNKLCGF